MDAMAPLNKQPQLYYTIMDRYIIHALARARVRCCSRGRRAAAFIAGLDLPWDKSPRARTKMMITVHCPGTGVAGQRHRARPGFQTGN